MARLTARKMVRQLAGLPDAYILRKRRRFPVWQGCPDIESLPIMSTKKSAAFGSCNESSPQDDEPSLEQLGSLIGEVEEQ